MIYVLWLILSIIGYCDWKWRTIPNPFILVMLIILLPAIFENIDAATVLHFVEVLVVGFILFLLGIVGAGDIKLLAVVSLGIKPLFFSLFLLSVSTLGGILAIVYLIYGYCTDIRKVRQRGIPYGLPIVISAAWAIFISLH